MRLPGLPAGPLRLLYAATLVVSIGSGAWWTCWALFAIRSAGLSTTEFGYAATLAGLVGLVGGAPVGYIADRVGTRETLVAIGLAQGAATGAYALAHSVWPFFAVACVAVMAERSLPGVRIAVISGLTAGVDRIEQISVCRVISSVGVAGGSALGGLVLYLDSRPGYLALIAGHALACIAAAVLSSRVPHVPSLADSGTARPVLVLRDGPFLVIMALSALLALNWGIISTALPLLLDTRSSAPLWILGPITAGNAVVIVLFQVRVSRRGATVPAAARLGLLCGLALAASCLLFAVAAHRSGAWLIVLLLLGAAVHAVGELLFVASGWGLSVGLTPDEAHGEYQGVFGTAPATALMLAPILMVGVVSHGTVGWCALAGLFLLGGLPLGPVSRWALRSGPRRAEAVPATAGPAPDPVTG